ncbi:hypothetical protein JTB14_025003 [Gonioctena quinquepunctata]|nr:hypothetical protein JTB14_025003 [Gonioctena quinquepunctata]
MNPLQKIRHYEYCCSLLYLPSTNAKSENTHPPLPQRSFQTENCATTLGNEYFPIAPKEQKQRYVKWIF